MLREIRAAVRDAEFIYVADDAGFPYGDWPEAELRARIVGLFSRLLKEHRPDISVIACNTASTLVLPALREAFEHDFVGTVPAIKPAAALTKTGMIAVLATPGTVQREYTFDLIAQFAPDVAVTLVGASGLAAQAERLLNGDVVDHDAILGEIAPCFMAKDGKRTDCVALACTHYPFLTDVFREIAPWPVHWLDPAPAIARRVVQLLRDEGVFERQPSTGKNCVGTAVFTSDRKMTGTLRERFAGFGLSQER